MHIVFCCSYCFTRLHTLIQLLLASTLTRRLSAVQMYELDSKRQRRATHEGKRQAEQTLLKLHQRLRDDAALTAVENPFLVPPKVEAAEALTVGDASAGTSQPSASQAGLLPDAPEGSRALQSVLPSAGVSSGGLGPD